MESGENRLIGVVDKFLLRLVLSAVGLLFVVQAFLFADETRHLFSLADRLEGEQIALHRPDTGKELSQLVMEPLQKLRNGKQLTISVLSEAKTPSVAVCINGKSVGDFRKGRVSITVYDNDYLEIDASAWQPAARFRIDSEAGVVLPINGVIVETKGDIAAIGRVKLK